MRNCLHFLRMVLVESLRESEKKGQMVWQCLEDQERTVRKV